MTLYTFREVSRHVEKSGKCAICGKPAKRSEKLFQTINPFNTNAAGVPKSRDEIYAELNVKAVEWRAAPVKHQKCEDAERNAAWKAERERRAKKSA